MDVEQFLQGLPWLVVPGLTSGLGKPNNPTDEQCGGVDTDCGGVDGATDCGGVDGATDCGGVDGPANVKVC